MEDGDDEVEPHQHIQIPQRSGVIVEIENECPNLRDSHFQGEGGHVYGRIVCRGDVIQINEIQYRQHDRPEDKRDNNAADPLFVKFTHAVSYRKQQHSCHHHKQGHATAYGTSQCAPMCSLLFIFIFSVGLIFVQALLLKDGDLMLPVHLLPVRRLL